MKPCGATLVVAMALFGGLVWLTGCATTDPPRFYQLRGAESVDMSPSTGAPQDRVVVGIGPVAVPLYVDRSQLVIRRSPHELELLELDEWAEPLSINISRVLIENLSRFIPGTRVTFLPWDQGSGMEYHIRIEVTRFDLEESGTTILEARWIITGADPQHILTIRRSRFKENGSPDEVSSMVAAMSRNLEALSREVAMALDATL